MSIGIDKGNEKLSVVKLGNDPVLFGIDMWTIPGATAADSGDGNILQTAKTCKKGYRVELS
jgi:hypothetical protein